MCGSYLYESPTRPAVLAFKLDDVRAFGSVLCGMFNTEPMISAEPDIAVTVPMHKSRVRERGYNQSAILAQKLSYPLGVEYRGDLSFRSINTVSQPEQPTAVVRLGALSGVFAEELKSVGAIVGRRILVVDDVFTTGSSLNAVSATLKSTQASWVGGAARTLQPIGEFN